MRAAWDIGLGWKFKLGRIILSGTIFSRAYSKCTNPTKFWSNPRTMDRWHADIEIHPPRTYGCKENFGVYYRGVEMRLSLPISGQTFFSDELLMCA
jgi:hypothetical protein